MQSFSDQLGRKLKLTTSPKRIISLVPSQTELLFDLGLDDEVIGITKFCTHPQNWFKSKAHIGGTKTANIVRIKSLQPDLIIANKEENVREQVEALQQVAPVWVSDIGNLEQALQMIATIGQLINKTAGAQSLVTNIKNAFAKLASDQLTTNHAQLKKCAYLIWKDPFMAAGGDTFISDMLAHCGFQNVFADQFRYPQVTPPQLSQANCQLLLLSTEPYPFKEKHIDELQPQLPATKIMLVDGEMFSWYGSRLLYAAEYFSELLQLIYIKT